MLFLNMVCLTVALAFGEDPDTMEDDERLKVDFVPFPTLPHEYQVFRRLHPGSAAVELQGGRPALPRFGRHHGESEGTCGADEDLHVPTGQAGQHVWDCREVAGKGLGRPSRE
jgi:protein-disulfide isomerase